MIEIRKVDTKPGLDVYHRDTQGITYTQVALKPVERVLWVVQENNDNATPMDEYHRIILTAEINGHPDEQATREYLSSEQGQALLEMVCEGYEIIWDGNNHVGILTDKASGAWDDLCTALEALPESGWQTWSAADWFGEYNFVLAGLTPDMSDAALGSLVEELESEAEADNVVILDSLYDYVVKRRAELAE